MMNAYEENLLPKARLSLAFFFDVGVNVYNVPLTQLYQAFINSGTARKFEKGDIRTVAGCSGCELAYDVICYIDSKRERIEDIYRFDKTKEYWLGWSLAYYQWKKNTSFFSITQTVSIESFCNLYDKYHEMDILQLEDYLDEQIRQRNVLSPLKRLRLYAGLSQKELAEKTGIPLRTIQQYEQQQKDIRKASVDYVFLLSKALYCEPQDIIL